MSVTSIETLGPLLEREGYVLFYASSKKNKILRLWDMLFKTVQFRNKVDFILIDTYSTSNFWYAFLVSQFARILKKRYISMLRGGGLPKRLIQNPRFSRMIFNNAYSNVAPSHYLLRCFQENGILNTVYIPNTIEIDSYMFKSRNEFHPKLLWVRAFAKIYNPFMAVEVFKKIKEQFPEATLCMVGADKDGSLEKTKQLAASYNLDVKFTGRLSKPEWISLSAAYDVFLNTTHFDNTPISVIEAMALGLPVISTNVGGIPFLLEDNKTAILVEDDAIDAMVVAIKKICDSKAISQNLANNARAKAESFDWQRVKSLWDEILQS